jgi:hypothetical protein
MRLSIEFSMVVITHCGGSVSNYMPSDIVYVPVSASLATLPEIIFQNPFSAVFILV